MKEEMLPSLDTKRWVISRKRKVVVAVRNRFLSKEEACALYNISSEEYDSWNRLFDRFGTLGLRVSRFQEYIPKNERVAP